MNKDTDEIFQFYEKDAKHLYLVVDVGFFGVTICDSPEQLLMGV